MSNIGIAIGGGKAFGVSGFAVLIGVLLVFISGMAYSKRTTNYTR